MNTHVTNSGLMIEKFSLPDEFVSDKNGITTAVQVSFNKWSRLVKEYQKYKAYYEMSNKLTRAFIEIKETQKGLRKEKSLSEFLNKYEY